MPPSKGPIWGHFLSGEKQNESHIRAHCRGCIENERPDGDIVELDDEGKPKLLSQSWVIEGNLCVLSVHGLSNINMEKRAKETLVAYSESKTLWLPIFWEKVVIVHAHTHLQRPGRRQER